MMSDRLTNALGCLSEYADGCVLSTTSKMTIKGRNCTVLTVLLEKHTCRQKLDLTYNIIKLKHRDLLFQHYIFKEIDGYEINVEKLKKTNDGHDPSGVGTGEHRQTLTYKFSSIDLSKTVSEFTVKFAAEDLISLSTYNACFLLHSINVRRFDQLALASS